ncbi:MAG: sulfite exporter TauE/SafE family protein [Pseudomonadota bacterium]
MVFQAGELLYPAIAVIFLLAGTLKGVLGFGLPMISMALLPFFVSIEQAVSISALVAPFTNLLQLFSSGNIKGAVKFVWPVIVALFVGVIFTHWFLQGIEGEWLLLLVGATILLFCCLEFSGFRFNIEEHSRTRFALGFGFLAGIAGALTALNGWAFVLYLVGCNLSRAMFRSSIAVLFIVSGILVSSSFWALGWITGQTIWFGLIALAASFVGMWIGDKIGQRVPNEQFRKIILFALAVLGSIIVARAFS